MDTYMHKRMASVGSLEKIEIIRSQEFMPSKARLKFLKKMIILGPKTAILGPQFLEFWCWGLIFGGRGARAPGAPPGSAPACTINCMSIGKQQARNVSTLDSDFSALNQ